MNNNQGVDYLLTDTDDQNGYPIVATKGIYAVPNATTCVTNKYVQISPSQ